MEFFSSFAVSFISGFRRGKYSEVFSLATNLDSGNPFMQPDNIEYAFVSRLVAFWRSNIIMVLRRRGFSQIIPAVVGFYFVAMTNRANMYVYCGAVK